MKVNGPDKSGKTQGASKAGAKGKTSPSGGSFGDFVTKNTQSAAPSQGAQSIAQVDVLLALQGAEDPAQGRAKQRMRKRANVLLNELEQIRMAMLGGRLTVGHMIDIADVVASHREKIMDPVLTGIMDEIDLRVQVELAKMRVAIDAQAARK